MEEIIFLRICIDLLLRERQRHGHILCRLQHAGQKTVLDWCESGKSIQINMRAFDLLRLRCHTREDIQDFFCCPVSIFDRFVEFFVHQTDVRKFMIKKIISLFFGTFLHQE